MNNKKLKEMYYKRNFFSFIHLWCYIYTSCKRSVARRVRVLLTPEKVVTMPCIQLFKIIKHVKICYYIFLSMILVEKAQYNSCCFCCKKKKNYNAVVSRQNI